MFCPLQANSPRAINSFSFLLLSEFTVISIGSNVKFPFCNLEKVDCSAEADGGWCSPLSGNELFHLLLQATVNFPASNRALQSLMLCEVKSLSCYFIRAPEKPARGICLKVKRSEVPNWTRNRFKQNKITAIEAGFFKKFL